MKRSRQEPGFDRRGSVLVFAALALVALLSAAALAIDLGMLFDTRQDAQRAADAAALAGASAFLSANASAAVPAARNEALKTAASNYLRKVQIDTNGAAAPNTGVTTYTANEAVVTIFPATSRVRVRIRRAAVTTWFAKLFGQTSIPIAAWATAEASEATGAHCLRPFALPDIWSDPVDDVGPKNGVWDPGETWTFDPPSGDTYEAYDPANPGSGTATGYGSGSRNLNDPSVIDDYGRPMSITYQDPAASAVSPTTPTFFYPFKVGNSQGANDYAQNIHSCNPALTNVGVPYGIERGNDPADMVSRTEQEVNNLIAADPGASWVPPTYTNGVLNPGTGIVTGSNVNWVDSPRVIKVGLFDPNQITSINGGADVTLNNIALLFLQGFDPVSGAVQGVFLYYASGTGGGPVTGPLVRVVRLVE